MRANKCKLTFLVICLSVFVILPTALKFVPCEPLSNQAGDSQALYDRRGELLNISLSHDDKYRIWTPLKKISLHLQQATLAKEDLYFYQHPGVNPLALLRASYQCLISSKPQCSGASTITMQLARLRYGLHTRSFIGKLTQIWKALLIEAHFSKEEILEAYLNRAPYGSNIEGVEAASLVYFSEHADNLTPQHATLLSVIPQSPTARALSKDSGLVLARTKAAVALAKSSDDPTTLNELNIRKRLQLPRKLPHLAQRLAIEHPEMHQLYTAIDTNLQTIIEERLSAFVERNRYLGIKNGAVLLLEYPTMKIRAYVGSASYFNADIDGAVDGVKAKRSPGSALKPFLYAKALESGLIHPQSILKDTEINISNYNPENYEGDFLGPISATQALVKSRNVPAVQLSQKLRGDGLYELLQNVGITKLKSKSYYGLALTLGGVEVSLQELVTLYASLANGGKLRSLEFLDLNSSQPSRQVISKAASSLTIEILRNNPRPGASFREHNSPVVAWKTGTSFGFRDAWSLGVVGQYVLGVWVGNFDGQANPAFVGRETAGPLFFSIVDALAASNQLKEPQIIPAQEIKQVQVCSLSGQLPNPYCQQRINAKFIAGVSPIDTCSVHRPVLIDLKSGLRVCPGQIQAASQARQEIFEFWPSDIGKLFQKAGIKQKNPPNFMSGCSLDHNYALKAAHSDPQITSPQSSLSYVLYSKDKRMIPFSAVADGDTELFWFVDDQLVGSTSAQESFMWEARPGNFVVRVVDKNGSAASARMLVSLVN